MKHLQSQFNLANLLWFKDSTRVTIPKTGLEEWNDLNIAKRFHETADNYPIVEILYTYKSPRDVYQCGYGVIITEEFPNGAYIANTGYTEMLTPPGKFIKWDPHLLRSLISLDVISSWLLLEDNWIDSYVSRHGDWGKNKIE